MCFLSSKFQCSKPMENEKKGSFYFRDKPVPERVGKYTIQFCLSELNKKILLYSQQITINVMANQPVKLAPESPLQTQVVSYSEDISKRILVENLTLRLMDQYDNPAGQELSGKVEICIKNSKSKESLPLFEGKLESLKMQLLDGEARITRLAIMENSPGEHGATYTVLFRPVLSTGPTVTLASYEFPFIFTNDSQNQQIILERSRKRETLNATIQKLTNQMDLREKIIAEYSILFEKSSMNELTLRTELNRSNLNIQKNAPIETIAQIHDDMHNEARRIHDAPRRTYNIHHPYMGTADVLGNVGNLAKVEDDTAAWVISWLLRGDMDCVITTTTAAAQRIYNDTGGRQQVMPLDTINADCRRPFPPLPHIRNGINLFDPMGNPVYVVDVLIYPQHQKDCEIVFRNLIGNTILIDDLDTGNMYRRMVVQNNMSCPTILTRQGDQISSKGNFGGAQNKAPPVGQLHLFGAPLPERYHQLQHQIDLLRKYKNALEKKLQTRREYDEVKKRALPINEKTENERKELCKQLQEVERQLAIQVRPNKRVSVDCGETSGMNPKRPK